MSTQVETSSVTESIIGKFGNGGKFSQFMSDMFKGCIERLGMSPACADKISRNCASDIGKAMKNGESTIKIGSISEDGKVTIGDSMKVKGIAVTRNISIARALQYINEAGKNGLSFASTDWALTPALSEYVTEVEAEVAEVK